MDFSTITNLIPAGLKSVASGLPFLRSVAAVSGSTLDAVAAVVLPVAANLLPEHERDAITLENLHEVEGIIADAAAIAPQAVALEQRVVAFVAKVGGELAS